MADRDPAKIALFDLDGTLADYDGQMRKGLAHIAGPMEPEFLDPSFDVHSETRPWLEARKRLIKQQPGWWRNLPRFQLGWDVLQAAKKIGFDITILTKGPYTTTSAWTEKVDWCRNLLPHTKVTITEDKSAVYGRVLVDDWPAYVEPWLAVRPRGLVIMPAHPWNRDFEHDRAIIYDGSNIEEVIAAMQVAFDR